MNSALKLTRSCAEPNFSETIYSVMFTSKGIEMFALKLSILLGKDRYAVRWSLENEIEVLLASLNSVANVTFLTKGRQFRWQSF